MTLYNRSIFARYLAMASLLLFLAVALGAFGAHGLAKLFEAKQMANWHTAINYMVIHAFALMVVAVLTQMVPDFSKLWQSAGLAFLIGILLFSGSLMAWALTLYKPLVFLTPIGGVAFMIGWLILFWGALKIRE